MSFLSSLGGGGMGGGTAGGLGAMGGGGNGLGSILASLGLGGGGQKKPQTGPTPPPTAPMAPGENAGQANPGHGGMPHGLAQAFQRIGAGLQQQGQAPQDGPLPQAQFQQFDPLQFLSSLGQNNWLGQLGGMR